LSQLCRKYFPDDCDSHSFSQPGLGSEYRDVAKYFVNYRRPKTMNPLIAAFAVSIIVAIYSPLLTPFADYIEDGKPKFDVTSFDVSVSRLNPRGSPGYPYTEKYATKRDVIAAYNNGTLDLHEAVFRRLEDGISIMSVAGKREVRDTIKLIEDIVRTFVVGPIDTNILCLIACLRFHQAIVKAKGPIHIGMSHEHGGTVDYLNYIKRFRDVADSDHPKWDASVEPEDYEYVCMIHEAFLSPQSFTIFSAVCSHECNHFLLMSDGYLGYLRGGGASGGSFTSMLNSFVNIFKFYYCIASNRLNAVDRPLTDFLQSERISDYVQELMICVYGDDRVHSSSPEWRRFCSCPALNAALRSIGHRSYNDNYEDNWCHPEDAVFLSMIVVRIRGFPVPAHTSRGKIIAAMVTGALRTVPPGARMSWPAYQLNRLYQYSTLIFGDQHFWRTFQKVLFEYEQYLYARFPHSEEFLKQKRALHLSFDEALSLYVDPLVRQSACAVPGNMTTPHMSKNMKEVVAEALTPNNRGARNKGRVTGRTRSKSAHAPATKDYKGKKKLGKAIETIAAPAMTGYVVHGPGLKRRRPKTFGSRSKSRASRPRVNNAMARTGPRQSYIEDVSASSTAGAFSYAIDGPVNPGNNLFFPNETNSRSYEKFKFHSCKFTFIPSVGSNLGGNYAMYLDYDPVDGADSSMSQIVSNRNSDISPLWIGSSINLADKKGIGNGFFYVQQQSINSASALDRQQTPADFRIATQGCAANQTVGSVLIEYDVEYSDPKPGSTTNFSGGGSVGASGAGNGIAPASNAPLSFVAEHVVSSGTNIDDLVVTSGGSTLVAARNCCFELSAGSYTITGTGLATSSNTSQISFQLLRNSYGAGVSGATTIATSTSSIISTVNTPISIAPTLLTVTAPTAGSSQKNQYFVYAFTTPGLGESYGTITVNVSANDHQNAGDEKSLVPHLCDSKRVLSDPDPSFFVPRDLQRAKAYLDSLPECFLMIHPYPVGPPPVPTVQDLQAQLADLTMRLKSDPSLYLSRAQSDDLTRQVYTAIDCEALPTLSEHSVHPLVSALVDTEIAACRPRPKVHAYMPVTLESNSQPSSILVEEPENSVTAPPSSVGGLVIGDDLVIVDTPRLTRKVLVPRS
jgi:hypothetical protein